MPSIVSSREPRPPQCTNSSLGRRGEGAPQHPHPLAAETGTTVRGDVLAPTSSYLVKALLFRHPTKRSHTGNQTRAAWVIARNPNHNNNGCQYKLELFTTMF